MNRLKEKYVKEVRPQLQKHFKLENINAVPQVKKVVINAGVGKTLKDPKYLEAIINDLKTISGQMPVKTMARKSIAGFKIRENQVVGVTVTLRGKRMFDFLDKLVNSAMPRIRDFRGVSPRAFDGRGNYSLGVKEQIIFPEIQYDQIDQVRGMDITITTTARDNRQGRALLEAFNFPFRK